MKKASIFSKKFVSWLLSVSIIAGTLACLSTTTLFAATETDESELKTGVLKKVTYDFEDSNEYLDLKYSNYKGNHENANVAVKLEDSTTNKYLTLKAEATAWNQVMVNFPFVLENNAKYKVSYQIKSETGSIKLSSATSGFYVGKETTIKNPNADSAWAGADIDEFRTTKLADLYDDNGDNYTKAIPSDKWTDKSYVFETGESDVTDDFKYLCLNFRPTEYHATDNYSTICIDDLVIEKLDPNVGFYDFAEGTEFISRQFAGDNTTEPSLFSTLGADDNTTNVLKFDITNYRYTGVVFPFEMVKGATYEISYNYQFTNANAKLLNNGVYADIREGKVVPAVKLSPFIDSKGTNQVADTGWKTHTFKVTANDVTEVNKYLAIALQGYGNSGTSYVYLDNVKIERVSAINFVAYEGKNESTNITIPSATGKVGEKVSSDCLNVPGYNIVGIYTDAEFTNKFTGTEFTIGAADTTYYVKYERQTSATFDFEDGIGDVKYYTPNSAPAPVVVDGALKIRAGSYLMTEVIFPFELEAGATYKISYDYKSTKTSVDINGNTGIMAASMAGKGNYKSNIINFLTHGVNDKMTTEWVRDNKLTFTTNSTQVTDVHKYLTFALQENRGGDGYIYLDNVKIEKVGTISFKAYVDGVASTAISIDPITGEVGTQVPKSSLNVPCYDIVEIYEDAELTRPFTGENFTIGSIPTTYYVVCELKQSAEFDFDTDGMKDISFVKGDTPSNVADPEVVDTTDKDNNNTKALKVQTYGWNWTKLIFPFELEAGATYKISYDYKCDRPTVSLASPSGILAATSAGGTVYANKFGFFIQESGEFSWEDNKISDTKWYSREFTFTATADKVYDDYKYLAIMLDDTTGGIGYIYLDNLVIEKVVKLTFGSDVIGAQPGSTVELPEPTANFGSTFSGWYSDAETTRFIGNAGDTIPCPAVNTTYYAKWVKNTSCEVNFDDGSYAPILSSGEHTPEVVTDPDDANNMVLNTNGINKSTPGKYKFTLPVELQNGVSYTVSFKYKAVPKNTKPDGTKYDYVQLNPTGKNNETEVINYVGSYIALADNTGTMKGKPLTLLLGDNLDVDDTSGNCWNEPNKVYNTAWKTRTYTFTFVADESAQGKFAMLQLYIYYDEPAESIIYFDDISIQETPTATFNTGEDATQIEPMKVAPGAKFKPGCPTRAGYTFKGWRVGDKIVFFDEITMPKENTTYTAEWEKVYKVGNLNKSVDKSDQDTIDNYDFVELKQILLGIKTENLNLADCSGDATVDILDLVRLKKYLVNPNENALGKTVYGNTGYQLVWNEEFDGNKLNTNTFTSSQTQGYVEGVTYTDDQIVVSDGTVKLNATKNVDGTVDYANAIVTDNTMNFKHGYVEVRAKLPYLGQGEWPAIWGVSSSAYLAGTQKDRAMEIDLAENMGNGTLQAQIHNWLTDGVTDSNDHRNLIPTKDNTNQDTKEQLSQVHTYGMLWTETSVTFYLDDVKYASYEFKDADDEHVTKELADQLISLRIENKFNPDAEVNGGYKASLSGLENNAIEVEYVRLYQIPEKSILISKK